MALPAAQPNDRTNSRKGVKLLRLGWSEENRATIAMPNGPPTAVIPVMMSSDEWPGAKSN